MWDLASCSELPRHVDDLRMKDFAMACSGGEFSGVSIGAALAHDRESCPQCFMNGSDDAICTMVFLKSDGK